MNLLKFSVLHQDVTITKRDDLEVHVCLDDPAYLDEKSSKSEAKDPRFPKHSVYRGYSTLFHNISLTQKESGRLEPSHGSLSVLRTSEWSLELVLMSPNFWGNRDYFPKSLYCGHANLDKLNAVSTTKGCYVGQETYTRYMHAVDWSSLSQTKAQKARSSSSLFVGSFFLSTSWCLLFLRDGV